MQELGWFAVAPGTGDAFPAAVPRSAGPERGDRPELADVGRLGRRALRGVLRAARSDLGPSLRGALLDHLGVLAPDVAVVAESWPAYDHVNVQAGLEAWLAGTGRDHEVVGVTGFQHREFGLAELLEDGPQEPWGPRPGKVATVNVACGPDSSMRPCVVCAVYLVTEGERRTALLLRGPDRGGMHEGVSLQIVSTEPGAAAQAAVEVRRMTLEHNVFRGQVLSFGGEMFGPRSDLMTFHGRPRLDRSALVLPDGVVETIERQVVGVGRHRARLLASGQHLKRGLLLYGPPGTGKTHTVRYLLGRTPGVTVVQLTGVALHLIAEDRGEYPGQHPLLFQLLNEMDGLADDADVVFVLTTNRADVLEPALAARPGRVDQAVELGLPDTTARRALLELYRGSLQLDAAHLDHLAAQTEGVTASFLKELLRRSAVIAATSGASDGQVPTDGPEVPDPVVVTAADMDAALEELRDTRNAMTRILLGGTEPG